jgi:hypothetical protein
MTPMGETILRLDPDNAAKSILVRLGVIKQHEDYIRKTMARYDGLRSFETQLEAAGVAEDVRAIVSKPEAK